MIDEGIKGPHTVEAFVYSRQSTASEYPKRLGKSRSSLFPPFSSFAAARDDSRRPPPAAFLRSVPRPASPCPGAYRSSYGAPGGGGLRCFVDGSLRYGVHHCRGACVDVGRNLAQVLLLAPVRDHNDSHLWFIGRWALDVRTHCILDRCSSKRTLLGISARAPSPEKSRHMLIYTLAIAALIARLPPNGPYQQPRGPAVSMGGKGIARNICSGPGGLVTTGTVKCQCG